MNKFETILINNLFSLDDKELLDALNILKRTNDELKLAIEKDDIKENKEIIDALETIKINRTLLKESLFELREREITTSFSPFTQRAINFNNSINCIKKINFRTYDYFKHEVKIDIRIKNNDLYVTTHEQYKSIPLEGKIPNFATKFIKKLSSLEIGERDETYGNKKASPDGINYSLTIRYKYKDLKPFKVKINDVPPYNFFFLSRLISSLYEHPDFILTMKKKVSESDYKTFPMPEKNYVEYLNRKFSKTDLINLSYGHIPEVMEDKWFYYVNDNKLYAYRSWTGYCIFILELDETSSLHKVIVNGNDEEYHSICRLQDIAMINGLLNEWCSTKNDFYLTRMKEVTEKFYNKDECLNYVPNTFALDQGIKPNTCESCIHYKAPLLDPLWNGDDAPSLNETSDLTDYAYLDIVGLQYYIHKEKLFNDLKVGDKLIVKRDLHNKYDKNAIMFLTLNNEKIGYISRKVNKLYLKYFDNKNELEGTIYYFDKYKMKITVKIKLS